MGGVHILPFFPSSADRGFAPICYDKVDERFGDFYDIESLSKDYYLMFDFMVNHISAQSEYFKDFLLKKDRSEYKDFFIRYSEFWENGCPTNEQIDKIYKRKPRAPYIMAEFADGSTDKIWCTFCEEQIDLDVTKEKIKKFIKNYDYQLKFVCRDLDSDFEEVKDLLEKIGTYQLENVMIMPQADCKEELERIQCNMVRKCVKYGFRYANRLQLQIWDNSEEA